MLGPAQFDNQPTHFVFQFETFGLPAFGFQGVLLRLVFQLLFAGHELRRMAFDLSMARLDPGL